MKVLGEVPHFFLSSLPSDDVVSQRRIQSELALLELSDPPASAETNQDEKARQLTELILKAQHLKQDRNKRRPKDSRRRRAFEGYDRAIEVGEVTERRGLLFDRKS